jgi:hypothetical protein
MRPLVYALNGILTRQTVASWPDEFAAWCEHEGVNAQIVRKEYFAGLWPWWNRLVRNPRIARGIVAEILADRAYHIGDGRDIHFVAHSNGTHIAVEAVKQLARRGIRTHTIILAGSILNPDIESNGIAELMREGLLLNAYAYISRKDSAVGFTRWYVIRRLCAYRDLGVTGWKANGQPLTPMHMVCRRDDAAPDPRWCFTRDFTPHDHGTYFDKDHRDQTFTQIREDLGL